MRVTSTALGSDFRALTNDQSATSIQIMLWSRATTWNYIFSDFEANLSHNFWIEFINYVNSAVFHPLLRVLSFCITHVLLRVPLEIFIATSLCLLGH